MGGKGRSVCSLSLRHNGDSGYWFAPPVPRMNISKTIVAHNGGNERMQKGL